AAALSGDCPAALSCSPPGSPVDRARIAVRRAATLPASASVGRMHRPDAIDAATRVRGFHYAPAGPFGRRTASYPSITTPIIACGDEDAATDICLVFRRDEHDPRVASFCRIAESAAAHSHAPAVRVGSAPEILQCARMARR